jgi:tetratricopeptide (TPR) repeat protein
MNRYRIFFAIVLAALLLAASGVPAQELLLQEERDYRFAEQLAEKELHDLAAQQFTKFVAAWPTSPHAPEALFRAAESYEAIEAFPRAADTYLQLVLSYPEATNSDKALFNRGKLLAQMGDPLNAALTLERIPLFMPKSDLIPLALVSAAELFRTAGKAKQAFDASQNMLARFSDSPLRPRALYLMANLQRDARKPLLALQELDRIASNRIENGLDVQIALLRGQLLNELGRYAQSDSVFQSLIKSEVPSDSIGAAACNLVQSLFSRALYQEVIQTADKALERPMNKAAVNTLRLYQGDSWTLLGENHKALTAFEGISAEAMTPLAGTKLAFRQGVLQRRLAEPGLALPWFTRILAQSDTITGVTELQRLALPQQIHLFIELENPAEALKTLRLLFDAKPRLRDLILLLRGTIERTILRNPVDARQDYAMLAEFYPASPLVDDAALGVAQCYDDEGERRAAIKAYETCVTLYPAATGTRQAENRLHWLRLYEPLNAAGQDRWLSRSILASGDPSSILAWAGEKIERDHDYKAGLDLFRDLPTSGEESRIDEIGLYYLTGLAHARLSEMYALTGDNITADLHTDSLLAANQWLQEQQSGDERSGIINRFAMLAQWQDIQEPLRRAAFVDSILARIEPSDSLAAALKLEQVRIWYGFAIDSSSAHWLARAASACDALALEYAEPRIRLETAQLRSTLFLTRQQPDSAIYTLQNALASGRNSAAAANTSLVLAELLEKTNRLEEAAELYQDWLARYSYSERVESVQNRLCQLYFRLKRFDLARSCMSQNDAGSALEDLAPYLDRRTDDDLLWLSAQAWLLQKNIPPAISAFKEYLRLSPEGKHRGEAMLALADLYLLDDNPQAAESHLEQLATAVPGDSLAGIALARMADLLYDRKQYGPAVLQYARLKAEQTGEMQQNAAMREVLCEFKQENVARARQLADAFKKSYKDRKAEAQFLYEDGMICLINKDFKAAEQLLKELSTKYKDLPEGADGELGLARMYATLNNTEEAMKILTGIPNKYSDPRILALSYINLGEFYYENRQLENCVTAGRKALEYAVKGPEQQRALSLLITVFDDLRLWDNAVVLLRQYITNYPKEEGTFNRKMQLGVFLINLKEYDRGVDLLKSLLLEADAESEAEIQYWIAKAFHERGEMSQAIIEFLKVKYACQPSKLPWGTTALYEAGQTYLKLGNLTNARALFQQIVRELGVGDQFGRVANERIREIDAQLAQQKG